MVLHPARFFPDTCRKQQAEKIPETAFPDQAASEHGRAAIISRDSNASDVLPDLRLRQFLRQEKKVCIHGMKLLQNMLTAMN